MKEMCNDHRLAHEIHNTEVGAAEQKHSEKENTLLGERVRRRREPDVSDAGIGDVFHLAHQEVVPSPVLLPGLPVEALMEDNRYNSNSVQTITAPTRVTKVDLT